MKFKGIVRHLDDLGRVVIPKEMRRTLSISNGAPLEILTTSNMIVIRPYKPDSKEILLNALQAMAKDTGADINKYLEDAREGSEPNGSTD